MPQDPNPDKNSSNAESFFEPTRVLLFGKPFKGLKVDPGDLKTVQGRRVDGPPSSRIAAALKALKPSSGNIARIYSFSFEGHYYKLPRPLLFVVSGDGESPGNSGTVSAERVGTEGQDWRFSADIKVWVVDKDDIAICLDIEIGDYERLLLAPSEILQDDATSRSAMASRSAAAFRSAAISRSAMVFRSAMVGPHQDR